MSFNPQPFFRKIIPPWYDSKFLCAMQLIFMLCIFLFGCVGISAAGETDQYQGVLWVPSLLIFLSGTVFLSTAVRLVHRREPG
jgi:hypothetical protein